MKIKLVPSIVVLMAILLISACSNNTQPPLIDEGQVLTIKDPRTELSDQNASGDYVVTGIASPVILPGTGGLSSIPDKTIDNLPDEALLPSFIIEHRSFLNGKVIVIKGVVVETLLGEKACPPRMGGCAQPRIFIADSFEENRDKNYETYILLNGTDENYKIGDTVEFSVMVYGSKIGVSLVKKY